MAMNTENVEQEAREEVMITFSLKGEISPPVSLRDFLERTLVFVKGNTLTLSPFPTWCEDADSNTADSKTWNLAHAVDDIDVDRNFQAMLEFSIEEDTTDDEVDALENVLMEVVSSL